MEEEIRQVDQELQCTQVALKEVEGLHLKGQVYERRSAIFFKARRDTTIQHQREKVASLEKRRLQLGMEMKSRVNATSS